jgi:hypothetical protein
LFFILAKKEFFVDKITWKKILIIFILEIFIKIIKMRLIWKDFLL